MTKILKFVVVMFLGIVSGLLIFEGSLQMVAHTELGKVLPAIEPQLGQPDSDIGYAFTPNSSALWTRENRAFITINSLGLRDDEIAIEKPEGQFRIALSGDSVVEALQVEGDKVFENLTEKRLQAEHQNVNIMNFAMAGNGPLRQLTRLEKFATPLKPDFIIMMMSAGDFLSGELLDDSQNPAYKMDETGNIVRSYGFRERFSQRHANDILGQTFLFLIHNSHVFRMFYDKKNIGIMDLLGFTSHAIAPQSETSIDQPLTGCETENISALYRLWVGKNPEKEWQVADHFFGEVYNYSQTKKTIIALYIPMTDSSCKLQIKQREEIIDTLHEVLQKHGIIFIDWNAEVSKRLLHGYSQTEMNNLHGFGAHMGAGHLNYRGHEIFSEVLYAVIKENL